VEQKFGKRAILVPPLRAGGYNFLYRLRLEGVSTDVVVRQPMATQAQFPEEKTFREAATAMYIQENTQLPIPRIFYHGKSPEIGPFMILQHVKHRRDLSDLLTIPDQSPDVTQVLNPDILETTLENIYNKAARYLLQLSQPTFPRIGSLVQETKGDNSVYSVAGRPITQNMNNMLQLGNIPRSVFSSEHTTYETADEWYIEMAKMHLAQLVFQHNDLVSSEDDCRNKYVARQLYLQLARQGRLSSFGFADDDWSAQSEARTQHPILCPAPVGSGSFRLWNDDLRATNFLINESEDIIAVIDWEFTYTAPTQFILDPPWWLLLDSPEMWLPDMDDWTKVYDRRLKTWISAMKRAEDNYGGALIGLPLPLSTYIQESWETGRFWVNYAARKSWAFDSIYWKYLDERFFGERRTDIPRSEIWKARVDLLGERERAGMEPFVARKMEESKQRILIDDWDPKEVQDRLSELFFERARDSASPASDEVEAIFEKACNVEFLALQPLVDHPVLL
jgi:hypothetical protein